MAKPMATQTKAKWKKRIARWKQSKLTAEEFALQEGVKLSTLERWRRRLGGKRGRAGRRRSVEVVGPGAGRPTTEYRFEILLWNKRVVRVRCGFTDDELARVLRVAERP